MTKVRSTSRWWFASLVTMTTASCATHSALPSKAPKLTEAEVETDVTKYLPLEDGTVFSYDTRSSEGTTGILIVQISRPRPGRVDLRTGARTERLLLDPVGIAYEEGGYLLKPPFTLGSSWPGRAGRVHVAAVDESESVPAGRFEGCVRTIEETQDTTSTKSVTSVYCPHVGLVSIDVVGATTDGQERETAVLKSFGPRVDVTGGSVTTDSVTTTVDHDPTR